MAERVTLTTPREASLVYVKAVLQEAPVMWTLMIVHRSPAWPTPFALIW